MDYTKLPSDLPVFSLHGTVIFSDTILPIPMRDEVYETLLDLSANTDFVVGVVQPTQGRIKKNEIPFFTSGTAAQIIGATELDDVTLLVQLKGLCRFVIEDYYNTANYQQYIKVSYDPYIYADSIPNDVDQYDQDIFLNLTKKFMSINGINPNWKDLLKISHKDLIGFITMMGPLEASEKQAILEKKTIDEQKKLLESIMTLSICSNGISSTLEH